MRHKEQQQEHKKLPEMGKGETGTEYVFFSVISGDSLYSVLQSS